jgi:hypothetical protein
VEERISRQQKNIVLDTQQGWQMMKHPITALMK